jgi:hypothetical protein
MDLNRLTLGDRVVAISAILFLIFMFFPWYGFDTEILGDYSRNGFDYFLFGWIPLLIAIAMVVQIGLVRFSDTRLPAPGPLTWGRVHLIAGAVAAGLVLIRLALRDEVGFTDFELDRKFGIFLAFLAALGLLAGGLLKTREADVVDGRPGTTPPPVA